MQPIERKAALYVTNVAALLLANENIQVKNYKRKFTSGNLQMLMI
jgi:hypothetical protein